MRISAAALACKRPAIPLMTLLVPILLTLLGCSYPKAVPSYEFLSSYERMTDEYDPLVSLVHAPADLDLSYYRVIDIGPVAVGEQSVNDPDAAQYATFFRLALRSALAGHREFKAVYMDGDLQPFLEPGVKVLRLEGKITRFDMGSGWQRYFFSTGATDFQIEGRLVDAVTGEIQLEFVDRRRHLGNTPFGPNPRTFKDEFVMKITIKQTAECFARFLEKAYSGLPPIARGPDDSAPPSKS